MADRRPIVRVEGENRQLPAGDKIPADALGITMAYLPDPVTATQLRDALILAGIMMGEPATAMGISGTLPTGRVGVPYTGSLSITGDYVTPVSIVAATLPPGLSAAVGAGVINVTGTPTTEDTYSVAIDIEDSTSPTPQTAEHGQSLLIQPESSALATFALPNAYMAFSDGGRRASYTGSPGNIGNCLSSALVEEATYFEVLLNSDSTSAAAGFQFYNDVNPLSLPTDAPLGQWYGQSGATFMLAPTWALVLMSAYGLPEAVGPVTVDAIDYVPTIARRVCGAIRPDGRGWLWSETANSGAGGYYGGGDPVLNTSPSFILPGSGDLYFGAASNASASNVFLIDPDDYEGPGAAGLAGFRQGFAG